ncbi:MAG: DNA internalization-related competence protein ComEC/Rec2 [Pseudomonadota bacterium]
MIFARIPLLPYFASFVLGIVCAEWAGPSEVVWLGPLVALVSAWLCWLCRLRPVVIFLLSCSAFAVAFEHNVNASHAQARPGEAWQGIPDASQIYEGLVSSYPQTTERGFSFRVDLQSWQSETGSRPLDLSAQVSLYGTEVPKRGERIRFRANLRTPRNFGNDREFDFERYARTRGVDLTGTIGDESRWVRVAPAKGWFRNALNAFREQGIARAESWLPLEQSALFKSLVLGDRINLDPSLVSSFRAAGVIHLLVVSGFHVAVMAALFAWLASFLAGRSVVLLRTLGRWRIKALGAAVGAIFFCLLTDLPIPTARALVAILLVLLAVGWERPHDGLAIWTIGAWLILGIEPLFLFDISAQLSFAAVLGILLALEAFPVVDRKSGLGRVWTWGKGIFIVTCGATVVTLPVIAFHFGRVTLWSLLGNYILAPTLGTIATPLGFVAASLGGPFRIAGDYLFLCFSRLLDLLLPVVGWFHGLSGSNLSVSKPSGLSLLGYYGCFGVLYAHLVLQIRRIRVLMCVSLLALLAPYGGSAFFRDEPASEIHILHVGEGDATLVRSSSGPTILLDAGPGGFHLFDAGERIVIPWMRVHGVDRIDLLAITHGDADHVGGAFSILDELPVGEIWMPHDPDSPMLWVLARKARLRGIPVKEVDARISPLRREGMELSVLYPPKDISASGWSSNERSVVYRLELSGYRMITAGDLDAAGESLLLKRHPDLRAELLKVSHHGSRTSSTPRFLDSVRPFDAVITAGWKNRFGHPSAQTLTRLSERGIRIWRGDFCGEFAVEVRPDSFTIDRRSAWRGSDRPSCRL